MKEVKWINYSRGYAIILMVLCHAISGVENLNIEFDIFWSTVAKIALLFHMQLFFVISGYLYARKKNYSLQVIKNKAIDLLIPYFIFNFIYTIIGIATNNPDYNFNTFLLSIICPVKHFCFIYVLFFIYVISIIMDKIINNNLIQISIFLIIYMLFDNYMKGFAFPISKIIYYGIFFLLGKYVFENNIIDSLKKYRYIIYFIFCFLALTILLKLSSDKSIYILCALSGTYTFCYIASKFKLKSIEYIGKNTIYIYLIHSLFLKFSRNLIILFTNNITLIILTTTLIGVLFPTIISIFAKKIVFLNIFFFPRKIKEN